MGSLILLPNLLTEEATFAPYFKLFLLDEVKKLNGLIAESTKGARQFFKIFKDPLINKLTLSFLKKENTKAELDFLLEPIEAGERWGLISDAGLPAIADPGSDLVLRARIKGLKVEAFGVTSSITGALMLSGLPGQHFTFHGYLPKEEGERKKALVKIEALSKKEGSTHIFIETPFRSAALFESLMQVLDKETYLSIAIDLSSPKEEVNTRKVKSWINQKIDFDKRPAIFLLNAKIK